MQRQAGCWLKTQLGVAGRALVGRPRGTRSLFMRTVLFCLALSSPAQAWEFTPGLPCVLRFETEAAKITLTHDPTQPLNTLSVRQSAPFAASDTFAMRFEGADGLTITTNRHSLSRDGRTLSVSDTGFGNVLNGLQFNRTAWAILGDQAIAFPLEGAAEPVAAFRLCLPTPGV